ncbi:ABC transporter permease [Thermotalea metallivorans]|uniref:Inner membrane ABC transporter permease protein YdcU n=1 Tax=Thermotalea metallivorans TaxID=520762 RepID=A0A140KZZ3_9FIRM|nr:sugar ABC transporter permease [Thermotalea metallivorans]KXG73868.1 Inner membrane ABC transporter permease protein YdcU [Thermotalea metallivorans]
MYNKLKPYIMLTPVLAVISSVFISGLVMGFLQSLGHFSVIGMKQFTFKYYKEVFMDRGFLESLKFSLYISFVSSVTAVIAGALLAYSILQNKHNKGIEQLLYKLPVIVPHSVAALLAYNMLAQSGIASRILYHMGIINAQTDFPSLVFDKNGAGILFAYLWKEIPFVAMVVYAIWRNMNDQLSEAALNLGANKRQVFWHVLLPLAMPTIASTFIIIFAFSFGAFEIPYLLGPTAPKTLPVKAYIEYTNPDLTHRPYTMAINMILTLISLFLLWLYNKAFQLISKYNHESRT